MHIENYDCIKKWSYKLAKTWVRENLITKGINSSRKFEQYKREGNYLPKCFPRKPDEYFKKNGLWAGWADFFGKLSNGKICGYLNYNAASELCQSIGIKNSVEYRNWKSRPDNLPARPDQYYKDVWESWNNFLGTCYKLPPKKVASKLQISDVRIIKHQLAMGVSGAVLAKTFGVSEMQISRIKKGENWVAIEVVN